MCCNNDTGKQSAKKGFNGWSKNNTEAEERLEKIKIKKEWKDKKIGGTKVFPVEKKPFPNEMDDEEIEEIVPVVARRTFKRKNTEVKL